MSAHLCDRFRTLIESHGCGCTSVAERASIANTLANYITREKHIGAFIDAWIAERGATDRTQLIDILSRTGDLIHRFAWRLYQDARLKQVRVDRSKWIILLQAVLQASPEPRRALEAYTDDIRIGGCELKAIPEIREIALTVLTTIAHQ
jgi:hypothetical protein